MKHLILGLIVFASAALTNTATAGTVTVAVTPANPIVMMTDAIIGAGTPGQKTIHAPWFTARYTVVNNSTETITVTGIKFTARSTEGGETVAIAHLNRMTEIHPGGSARLDDIYTERLGASSSQEYAVHIEVQGYTGTIGSNGAPLTAWNTFLTQ